MDALGGFQSQFSILMNQKCIDWERVSNLLKKPSLLGVAEGSEKQIVDQNAPKDSFSLRNAAQLIFSRIGKETIEESLEPRKRIIGLHIVQMISFLDDQSEISNIISKAPQKDGDFSSEAQSDLLGLIHSIQQLFCTYSRGEFLSTFGDLRLAEKTFTMTPIKTQVPSLFYVAPSRLVPKEVN